MARRAAAREREGVGRLSGRSRGGAGAALLLCIAAWLAACADPAAPVVHEHVDRLVIPGTEDAVGMLVDVDQMIVVNHIGVPFLKAGPAVVAGGTLLMAMGMRDVDSWELAAYDVNTGHELWQLPLASGGAPVLHDGVALGTSSMAINEARHELYCWPSERGGVVGVGVFNYQRRQVSEFVPLPNLQGGGVAFVPPYPDLPQGSVAAFGAVGTGGQRHAIVYFLSGAPLAVSDSLTVPTPVHSSGPVSSSSRRVVDLRPNLGGREILVATPYDIVRFDVTTLQLATSITRSNTGFLVVSPFDGRVFIPDPGNDALASTGLVVVYDRTLELSEIIDLHSLPASERPLGIQGGAVSADGRWLYLVTGVPRDGPLYGPDFSRLMVVSVSTGASSALPLATLGGMNPIPVP